MPYSQGCHDTGDLQSDQCNISMVITAMVKGGPEPHRKGPDPDSAEKLCFRRSLFSTGAHQQETSIPLSLCIGSKK